MFEVKDDNFATCYQRKRRKKIREIIEIKKNLPNTAKPEWDDKELISEQSCSKDMKWVDVSLLSHVESNEFLVNPEKFLDFDKYCNWVHSKLAQDPSLENKLLSLLSSLNWYELQVFQLSGQFYLWNKSSIKILKYQFQFFYRIIPGNTLNRLVLKI